jgi:hypothetical protein
MISSPCGPLRQFGVRHNNALQQSARISEAAMLAVLAGRIHEVAPQLNAERYATAQALSRRRGTLADASLSDSYSLCHFGRCRLTWYM